MIFGVSQAQELNCTVTVNADQIKAENNQVFITLQNALNEFVNRTSWTGASFKPNEKIDCSMFITVNSYTGGSFSASIQVQSARPVFNSTYATPVLNVNDKAFDFNYIEFENLTFNPNSFESNLVSVLAFYSYMIIGMDADTFAPQGGDQYLSAAQDFANVAMQSGSKGWGQQDGNQSRYFLINDMLSQTFAPFRQAMYEYHFEGLDAMSNDQKTAKEKIKKALVTLAEVHAVRPNSYLSRVFFDAKTDEIVSIYSGGPTIPVADLVENLNRLSPLNVSKWGRIRI